MMQLKAMRVELSLSDRCYHELERKVHGNSGAQSLDSPSSSDGTPAHLLSTQQRSEWEQQCIDSVGRCLSCHPNVALDQLPHEFSSMLIWLCDSVASNETLKHLHSQLQASKTDIEAQCQQLEECLRINEIARDHLSAQVMYLQLQSDNNDGEFALSDAQISNSEAEKDGDHVELCGAVEVELDEVLELKCRLEKVEAASDEKIHQMMEFYEGQIAFLSEELSMERSKNLANKKTKQNNQERYVTFTRILKHYQASPEWCTLGKKQQVEMQELLRSIKP